MVGRYGETQVRGAAFSMRTGEDEDRVILERGRVKVVRLAHRAEQVDLEPHEMVVATKHALQPLGQGRRLGAGFRAFGARRRQ